MVKLGDMTSNIMSVLKTIRLLSQLRRKSYWRLRTMLGFWPYDMKPYKLALRHKSANQDLNLQQNASSEKTSLLNNERLEFLGDAILGAIVADILFKKYRDKKEGFLTTMRSKIVCRSSLNKLAEKIGLDKLVLHSDDINRTHNSYINGNALEAFIGAIYIDRGYKYCYKFIEKKILGTHINTDKLDSNTYNYKSKLIEWCQKYQYKISFAYSETRLNNGPFFRCKVTIEGIECGYGQGYKKVESDQSACMHVIRKLEHASELREQIEAAFECRRANALEQSKRNRIITQMRGRKTIIFDLDGTLMDSLKDLYISTNYALKACGYEERSIDDVRKMVGNGVKMLIHKAMPKEITSENTPESTMAEEHCLNIFKEHYVEHCQDNTRLYPGIRELLVQLKERGYHLAIVSNKLQAGVTELHNRWFNDTIDVAIGESEGINKKPAPDMIEAALEKLGTTKEDAIYIGDSDVDLKTAKNSDLPCISVLWGFRSKDFLMNQGAVLMVEKPDEIASILFRE